MMKIATTIKQTVCTKRHDVRRRRTREGESSLDRSACRRRSLLDVAQLLPDVDETPLVPAVQGVKKHIT